MEKLISSFQLCKSDSRSFGWFTTASTKRGNQDEDGMGMQVMSALSQPDISVADGKPAPTCGRMTLCLHPATWQTELARLASHVTCSQSLSEAHLPTHSLFLLQSSAHRKAVRRHVQRTLPSPKEFLFWVHKKPKLLKKRSQSFENPAEEAPSPSEIRTLLF